MFPKTLAPTTRQALELIKTKPLLTKSFFLGGGTALALQLGHRLSQDLDFFSHQEFEKELVTKKLLDLKRFKLQESGWQTILGTLAETKVAFFYQRGRRVAPLVRHNGINIASVEDIAAMKLASIAGRGVKRDFIDLYFICRSEDYTLKKIFAWYEKKYGRAATSTTHLKKSLIYFDDAEAEPDKLRMLKKVSWQEVKEFFETEIKKIAGISTES